MGSIGVSEDGKTDSLIVKPMEKGTGRLLLRQILLCIVDGHGSVSYGRDNLPQHFGADISYGKNAGEIGSGGLVGDDITGGIQFQKMQNK